MEYLDKFFELHPIAKIGTMSFVIGVVGFFLTYAGRPRNSSNIWFGGVFKGNLVSGKSLIQLRKIMGVVSILGIILTAFFTGGKVEDKNSQPDCDGFLPVSKKYGDNQLALFKKKNFYYVLNDKCEIVSDSIEFLKTDKVEVLSEFKNGVMVIQLSNRIVKISPDGNEVK
jgi:hypothetical protein